MQAKLKAHGTEKIEKFNRYVCTFQHITEFADEDQQLCLLADLAPMVFNSFKNTIYKVVWHDLASWRERWFLPVEGKMKPGPLQEFSVCKRQFELEDNFKLKYEGGGVCIAKMN